MSDDNHKKKMKAEALWIAGFLVVLAFTAGLNFYITSQKDFSIATKMTGSNSIPNGSIPIVVTGYQWAWSYTYYNSTGKQTFVDNLNITVNQSYTLVVTSIAGAQQFAVIHDLYIPQMGIQIYAVPGQNNTITFTPDKTGTFVIECVEYCGYEHYLMRGYLTVVA
ncbi:MAG: hypothetical protein M1414_04730 [Candidatus Thermoplasmatota archaeon]|jgi:heme/copper-type cytochrome/quinol oxidase subunit 2|nr:hypothetical protein [Candidatus Thermoplasmatota archaeon]MCL5988192.1 hypothetical protein [Candidatus Thermoplasmatota archaeon]